MRRFRAASVLPVSSGFLALKLRRDSISSDWLIAELSHLLIAQKKPYINNIAPRADLCIAIFELSIKKGVPEIPPA